MRDAHRMKEKFDVSLDNRQIVSLLIAGIVVMGAVFVLGVVVGKNLAGNAQASAAPDLLSALDANAQALQNVQKDAPLTFQDELTRKAAAEPAAIPAPKATAKAPAPAEKPAAPKPAAPSAEKAVATRATLAPTPDPDTGELPPEEPEEVKPEAVAEAPKAPAPAPTPAPAAAPAVAQKAEPVKAVPVSGKVEMAPVPTRTTNKEGGGLTEAIARVAQPPAQAVKGGAFTLQISAFQDRQEADRFAARLRTKGYAPYILVAEVPGKGTWYRVRMGSFANRDAASRYLADFKRETQLDAFVAGTN